GTGKGAVSVNIIDKNRRTIYHRNLPVTQIEDWVSVNSVAVKLSGGETLLLLMTSWTPSAPATGIQGQFFSFNGVGAFVPVSGLLSPSCNEMDPTYFPFRNPPGHEGHFAAIDVWTGNFMVVEFYPLEL